MATGRPFHQHQRSAGKHKQQLSDGVDEYYIRIVYWVDAKQAQLKQGELSALETPPEGMSSIPWFSPDDFDDVMKTVREDLAENANVYLEARQPCNYFCYWPYGDGERKPMIEVNVWKNQAPNCVIPNFVDKLKIRWADQYYIKEGSVVDGLMAPTKSD